jgi:hypothetical protein
MFGTLSAKLLAALNNLIFINATDDELAGLAGLSKIGCAVAVAKLTKCGILRVDKEGTGFPAGTKCFYIDARWLDELEAGSQ